MKRNILSVMFALMLAFGLAACNADNNPKIAVVDAEQVFQQSQLAKDGMTYIEGLSRHFNERLAQMREEVMANPDDEALAMRLQEELMGLQQSFETQQMEAAEKLNALFDEVVQEYLKKNNLDAILPKQMAIATRDGADITSEIVKLLDAKTLVYGPAPAAATAAQPVSPAEPAEAVDAPADAPSGADAPAAAPTEAPAGQSN